MDSTRIHPEIAKRYDKPSLQIIPYKGGLKATIIGAAQSLVRISIIRADGKIVHQKKMYVSGESVPYVWNRKNGGGSGVYFMRMETPHGAVVKRTALFWSEPGYN